MKRWLARIAVAAVAVGLLVASFLVGYERGSRSMVTAEQEALEEEFSRSMSGVTLEGSFVVDGRDDAELSVERYSIDRVERAAGDLWVFHARIQYGDHDVTLPVPVQVRWAGDTPVVGLTDTTLPGLGTFTARVLFYRDHYAGMWSNPRRSGLQFGRIVR